MADIISFDPRQEPAEWEAWLFRVHQCLCELTAAVHFLQEVRSRLPDLSPVPPISPDTLRSIVEILDSDLSYLKDSVRDFESYLRSRTAGGAAPE